jgi:hypothetical protein
VDHQKGSPDGHVDGIGARPVLDRVHRRATCGSGLGRQTVCAHCGRVDDPAEIRAAIGPGMPADRLRQVN